ncbi:hypothetical protein SeMB42_g03878 [Synchytrium endobioticum]|uniref:C-8 sterol isomerase n=1 Tax=Synchytrium endobioticum TaxID=286115 RepID=A0A507D317_9FUNG|nr:hypothetical protein SeMB42_g03878 [Synchytrium endobioticum]
MNLTSTLFMLAALLGIFIVLDSQKHHFYIYDQNKLHALVQNVIKDKGSNGQLEPMIDAIVTSLNQTYPGSINMDRTWMFNNAGGAMGAMYIVHASLTEYLLIFGTPVGTEGHTGRYWADDYFIILKGEQWAFRPGQFEKMVFKAGEMHHLPRGVAEQYRMPEGCFALEYARGWIPLMLPFGSLDTFTSTLDFPSLGIAIWTYAKCILTNLAHGKI